MEDEDSGRGRRAEPSCPLPGGGRLLGLCNRPSIHDLLWGPLARPGGCASLSPVGFFLSPRPPLLSPPPTSQARTASTARPPSGTGRRRRPQKVKCQPGQGWFVLWRPGWVAGSCAHSGPAGLPLPSTPGLLITPFRCLGFLVGAHLEGLLQGGGRLDGRKPAGLPPLPGKCSALETCAGGE